ncbi:MAG: hypothetical protein AABZ11_07550 [Nitrospinota bacterium]
MDEYRFPGFHPKAGIKGVFGDSKARVVLLERTQKKGYAVVVARCIGAITTRRCGGYGIYPVERSGFIWKWRFGVFNVGDARR